MDFHLDLLVFNPQARAATVTARGPLVPRRKRKAWSVPWSVHRSCQVVSGTTMTTRSSLWKKICEVNSDANT